MRFQIKKVEPIGTHTGGAFVNRGYGKGGFEIVTSDVHPDSPGGDRLREARTKGAVHVSLGKGAARLGLRAEQLSGLEHGRYTFEDPIDFETAAAILAGKWPRREDGWPLCPVCNEDEIGCLDMSPEEWTIAGRDVDAFLKHALFCYRCAHTYPPGTFSAGEVET